MNSRQVNFFLTAADQASLVRQFATREAFVVVQSLAQDDGVRLLKTVEIKEMGTEHLKVYLARPSDVGSIQLNALDVVRSPVIEFVRCFHQGNLLRRGRLYFVTAYYDGSVLTRKDHAFLEWANTFISTARRKLSRDRELQSYLGDEARSLRQGETEFVL
jgi:hypothetical protein